MSVAIRKILDKFFLPLFYGICIFGVVVSAVLFKNVKQQQEEALLAYEKNLNFQGANEEIQLETSGSFSSKQLLYSTNSCFFFFFFYFPHQLLIYVEVLSPSICQI